MTTNEHTPNLLPNMKIRVEYQFHDPNAHWSKRWSSPNVNRLYFSTLRDAENAIDMVYRCVGGDENFGKLDIRIVME